MFQPQRRRVMSCEKQVSVWRREPGVSGSSGESRRLQGCMDEPPCGQRGPFAMLEMELQVKMSSVRREHMQTGLNVL